MQTLTQVTTSNLSPGALPICLYDRHGGKLFNEGFFIESEKTIKHLATQNIFVEQEALNKASNAPDSPTNKNLSSADIFRQIEHITSALFLLCSKIQNKNIDFHSELMALVDKIQTICDENSQAAMASLLLIEDMNYPIKHAVDVGILTEILTKKVTSISNNGNHC